ncbi:uncharacterized protein LOC120671785 isoform X2 [Panicum virgatum]|uniref:uncharacterized protein LOC120671785 isoform X2 n=1 Tax=Panicum virgatum TaxID=38727 RepID=UPI0019D5B498|nr:uncharacterized protein LOC120671785 isoform X2 [Panicum virgatum]
MDMSEHEREEGSASCLEGLTEACIDLNKLLDSPCLSANDACPIVGGPMDMSEHMRKEGSTASLIDLNKCALPEFSEFSWDAGGAVSEMGGNEVVSGSISISSNEREGCSSVPAGSLGNEVVLNQQASEGEERQAWQKRPRLGHMANDQEETTENPTALEKALKSFVTRKHGLVVQPSVGTHFDSMAEAFEFYNLYSWEVGFGIRFNHTSNYVVAPIVMHNMINIFQSTPKVYCHIVMLH